jgi:hypothetical protein
MRNYRGTMPKRIEEATGKVFFVISFKGTAA